MVASPIPFQAAVTILDLAQGVALNGTEVMEVIQNGQSVQITTQQLAALVVAANGSYREVVAAGNVTILPTDIGILLNKAAGAATDIILPLSSTRGGTPVWVKDYKGDSNVNNIRFVVNGTDTIDGFNQANADANGRSKIAIAYGEKTLWPRTLGGWYLRG